MEDQGTDNTRETREPIHVTEKPTLFNTQPEESDARLGQEPQVPVPLLEKQKARRCWHVDIVDTVDMVDV